eukprot:TRINITY_DN9608_c0_g1_i4.p1 TRINITY_DN9608_c0_g1~~TRINITY_DN9608_c0_g1_i4.p1  ORF type:complete len:510 (+),score=115.43 TRINITY_DN9608_c0_g1_i4:25-1530(+)
MATHKSFGTDPLMSVELYRTGPECPFSNDELKFHVKEGEVVWLKGPSGAGKTLSCLQALGLMDIPGVASSTSWHPDLHPQNRAGMLFQLGVLVDELNVHDNILLGLQSAGLPATTEAVKNMLSRVGLDVKDMYKMPNELSGGMLRRATLAQLLSQGKKIIILDEPFIGLDVATATGIANQLMQLKRRAKTSFVLISHQEQYAKLLRPERTLRIEPHAAAPAPAKPSSSQISLSSRLSTKLQDYLGLSLPLILVSFLAAGFAISLLTADVLHKTDVTDRVLEMVDTEFAPTAEGMLKAMIPVLKLKIKTVIKEHSPDVKLSMYCYAMAQLFVLEVGPLLTALLLAGRIGGSYAGEVATKQATNQNRLLANLGVSPRDWTLIPGALAAAIAAPLLTLVGTVIALLTAAVSAKIYSLGSNDVYWERVSDTVFDDSKNLLTYAPSVLLYRSLTYIGIIMVVAELFARRPGLQPRDISNAITYSVVVAGVCIICMDGLFSQVLLRF